MPLKLSTTIGKIQNIPNFKNIEIINEFLEYMRNNGSSEHHQNNNLKVVIAFGNFIGNDNPFLDINKKEQILAFLNTKVKSYDEDPDKRWITTWNPYYNTLKYLISGLIKTDIPNERKWKFFDRYLINMELIPYHSTGITFPSFLSKNTIRISVISFSK